jgi:hypothetical protein
VAKDVLTAKALGRPLTKEEKRINKVLAKMAAKHGR